MAENICDSLKNPSPSACPGVVIRPEKSVWPASPTGGVRPMSIQGRLYRERERLAGCGMTEQEREWRKQWIRDQRLSKNEPRVVPEIRQELCNPIRRFYRYPMDKLESYMAKSVGAFGAKLIRNIIAKSAIGLFGIYATAYYFKYNANDWTRKGGWRVVRNRPTVYPGDPDWPYKPERHVGADYADHGFKNSPIQKPLESPKANHVVHRVNANYEEDIELTPTDVEKILNYFSEEDI